MMLGFPVSTEFNKRIPKQKFYENLDVSPALRRVFVDRIKLVYWRNKLATSTLNIAAGEAVTEIEVFEVRLNDPQLDEAVLKQIDKEIRQQRLQGQPLLSYRLDAGRRAASQPRWLEYGCRLRKPCPSNCRGQTATGFRREPESVC